VRRVNVRLERLRSEAGRVIAIAEAVEHLGADLVLSDRFVSSSTTRSCPAGPLPVALELTAVDMAADAAALDVSDIWRSILVLSHEK
jgi:hypothetical protein